MTTRTAPLDRFYVAPENARHDANPPNIEELAANIEAYGLLQPLVAYAGENEDESWAVTDGSRRLAALQLLKQRGGAPGGDKKFNWKNIGFREIAQSDAVAASLAANTQRVDLSIVDAAVAWNRMSMDGKDVSEIARAFGVTERFVKGRIKLASLHEPILEALRTGEISLDVAQLYAVAHMARQETVWKTLGKNRRTRAYDVRNELSRNTLKAGDDLARFVGEEAYVAAGGQVETELFKSADQTLWLNPEIAEKLASEKLAAAAKELEAEGFLFVESAPEFPYGQYVDGNLGKNRKANPEEKARLDALSEREKTISAEMKAIEAAADARAGDDGFVGDFNDEEQERFDALEEEQGRIRRERERIKEGQVSFSDDAKKKSGVIVSIEDGVLTVQRGVVAPRERRASKPGAGGNRGAAASKNPAKPEPAAPMTNLTHEKTSRIASVIVGRALADRPDIALIALTAAMARHVFGDDLTETTLGEEVLTARGFGDSRDTLRDTPLLSDDAYVRQRNRWFTSIGKPASKLEARMTTWPQADVLALLAFCVGESVKVIEPNAAAKYDDDDARTRLALLGRLAGANPAANFIPDADYLGGFSRPSLEAAAAELEASTAGIKNKAGLAELIAEKAAGGGATATWVPPLLRTLCGMDEAPAPKAKPPAKKAAPKSKTKAKAPAKKVAKKAVKKVAKPAPKPVTKKA
ncbi:MAG: ParB/RepB/Spo0J family partition protein [Terricaulis sp.]